MKVALIGYGYWGKILHEYLSQGDIFELTRIYSPSVKNDSIYTNEIEMVMDDAEIKAVFIAAPINTHIQYIRLSINNGKHVFCEKPICSVYDNLDDLYLLRSKSDRIIYTDYIYNVSESIRKMKNELNMIGKIEYIQSNIKQYGNFYKNDNVYEVLGVHLLGVLLYILDASVDNLKDIKFNDIFVDEKGLALVGGITLKIDDIKCYIHNSLLSNFKERRIEVVGDKGTLIFDMLSEKKLTRYSYNDYKHDRKLVDFWNFDESNNINKSIEEFSYCINKKVDNFKLAIDVQKILKMR